MREYELVAADGTALRGWRHGRDGRPPLLGVGLIPDLWPSLLAPAAQLQLHSWYPRRATRSARPVPLDDHVADAVTVLDAAGLDRCVVLGWSVGVPAAAALALRHPDRVAGLLLVAGAPQVLPGLPAPIRSLLAGALTRGLRLTGPVLGAVLPRLPVSPVAVWPLRHSRLMRPAADPFDTARAAHQFLQQHWGWFLETALTAGPAPDLSSLRCPVTVLAGRHDVCTDLAQIGRSLASLPQARLRILPTSHFISLEAPQVVFDEVRALQYRASAVEVAVQAVTGTALTSGSQVCT
jgi:pimeloyl-ACP methyl ester carboxylesterase